MTSAKTPSETQSALDSEGIFFMTSLSPRLTDLPMSVWVSPRGDVRHDIRAKVNMTHGRQMNIDNTAFVAVRPSPRVVAGRLTPEDFQVVAEWISLNSQAIIAYWDEKLDADEFLERQKRLPEK